MRGSRCRWKYIINYNWYKNNVVVTMRRDKVYRALILVKWYRVDDLMLLMIVLTTVTTSLTYSANI